MIAVKKNQPKLYDAIEEFFRDAIRNDFEDRPYRCRETRDEGHGRTDGRVFYLARVPKDFAPAKDWPQVKAIGYALRYTVHDDGRETVDVRYYISTRYLSGKRFAEAVRGHWSIESMHGVLDVTFREDAQRARTGDGEQFELVATVRRVDLEARPVEGQHQKKNATVRLQPRLPRRSPTTYWRLIRAGRGVSVP